MGREVGGVFRIGTTCTPMVGSCQCMAKPLQLRRIRKFKKKKKYTFVAETIYSFVNISHYNQNMKVRNTLYLNKERGFPWAHVPLFFVLLGSCDRTPKHEDVPQTAPTCQVFYA